MGNGWTGGAAVTTAMTSRSDRCRRLERDMAGDACPVTVEEHRDIGREAGGDRLAHRELAGPAAQRSARYPRVQPLAAGRHDDVDVTPTELGVDHFSGELDLATVEPLVDRGQQQVVGPQPDGDRGVAAGNLDLALDRLAGEGPTPFAALDLHPVRHSDEAGDVLGRRLLEHQLRRVELLDL